MASALQKYSLVNAWKSSTFSDRTLCSRRRFTLVANWNNFQIPDSYLVNTSSKVKLLNYPFRLTELAQTTANHVCGHCFRSQVRPSHTGWGSLQSLWLVRETRTSALLGNQWVVCAANYRSHRRLRTPKPYEAMCGATAVQYGGERSLWVGIRKCLRQRIRLDYLVAAFLRGVDRTIQWGCKRARAFPG